MCSCVLPCAFVGWDHDPFPLHALSLPRLPVTRPSPARHPSPPFPPPRFAAGVSGMAFGAGLIKQPQQSGSGSGGGVQPAPGVGIQGVVGIGVGANGKKELPPGMKEFPGA